MSYAVIAELRARRGLEEALGMLVDAHARVSREEPGCLAFDVCQDPADPALFLLYAVYEDAAAYGAHRETEHFRHFRERAPELLDGYHDRLFESHRAFVRRD